MAARTLHARHGAVVALCLAASIVASTSDLRATTLDTMSAFKKGSRFRYYHLPSLKSQVARFPLRRAGILQRISITLAGPVEGRATVRVFGQEAGAPVPFLGHDLVDPLTLRKSTEGIEVIVVNLPAPVMIDADQFFIAVENLGDGVRLMSDSYDRPPRCQLGTTAFTDQCLKLADGTWMNAPRGFAIEAILEIPERAPGLALQDVTADVGVTDVMSATHSLAAEDIDRDGDQELLVGGRLLLNDGGGLFRDVTSERGISGSPIAAVIIDANGDDHWDLLFLGSTDTADRVNARLWQGRADGGFTRIEVTMPPIIRPTSVSIADVNGDGHADLFVGQARDGSKADGADLLLMSTGQGGFVDRSRDLYTDIGAAGAQGSQWIDIDKDGFRDLFVTRSGAHAPEVWRNNGDGSFSALVSALASPIIGRSVTLLGAHVRDRDGDGVPDVILAPHTTLAHAAGNERELRTFTVEARSDSEPLPQSDEIALVAVSGELQGAASWVDLDNDGRLEMFVAAGAPCRSPRLFSDDGRTTDRAMEVGLAGISAGPDALWVDTDNDGRVDLVTFVDHGLRVFRNASEKTGNHVSFELDGALPGTQVTVHTSRGSFGNEQIAGRGLLIQESRRFHFGIGDAESIDSVVVRWSDGERETYSGFAVNTTHRLRRVRRGVTESEASTISAVRAFPNPFQDRLELTFRLERDRHVLVEIYSLAGDLVATLHDAALQAGVHTLTWSARGANGTTTPQGTYVYRITADRDEAVGKVILSR